MTGRPVTLPYDAPISKALGLMRTRRIHEIPVLRNTRLIGMVTIESIARRGRWSLATKVEHLLVLPPSSFRRHRSRRSRSSSLRPA